MHYFTSFHLSHGLPRLLSVDLLHILVSIFSVLQSSLYCIFNVLKFLKILLSSAQDALLTCPNISICILYNFSPISTSLSGQSVEIFLPLVPNFSYNLPYAFSFAFATALFNPIKHMFVFLMSFLFALSAPFLISRLSLYLCYLALLHSTTKSLCLLFFAQMSCQIHSVLPLALYLRSLPNRLFPLSG